MSILGLSMRSRFIYFYLIFFMVSCSYSPIHEIKKDSSTDTEINDELQLSPRKENSEYQIPKNASAVDNLLNQASEYYEKKNYEAASSLVERAIRLGPNDPRAYFSLSQVRFQQGLTVQAEILIHKAEILSKNQPELSSLIRKYKNFLQYKK